MCKYFFFLNNSKQKISIIKCLLLILTFAVSVVAHAAQNNIPVCSNCSGNTKGSNAVPCCAKPDPGPAWEQRRACAVEKKTHMCVLQIEQVSQLAALVQAQLEYHSRTAEILQQLSSKMEDRYGPPGIKDKPVKTEKMWLGKHDCVWLLFRIKEVSGKPRKEYTPKPRMTLELLPPSESHNGGIHSAKSPGRSPGREGV